MDNSSAYLIHMLSAFFHPLSITKGKQREGRKITCASGVGTNPTRDRNLKDIWFSISNTSSSIMELSASNLRCNCSASSGCKSTKTKFQWEAESAHTRHSYNRNQRGIGKGKFFFSSISSWVPATIFNLSLLSAYIHCHYGMRRRTRAGQFRNHLVPPKTRMQIEF